MKNIYNKNSAKVNMKMDYRKKKGQAAIEFLMTYGWMLLIVLIVGALIFSFVDFGSLLPNQVDLTNNLRGSPTESFATNAAGGSEAVTVVFTYTGSSRVEINASGGTIDSETGFQCNSVNIRNARTEDEESVPGTVTFLNGGIGVMKFDCDEELLSGDVLQGEIRIELTSTNTGVRRPSAGPIRLAITES